MCLIYLHTTLCFPSTELVRDWVTLGTDASILVNVRLVPVLWKSSINIRVLFHPVPVKRTYLLCGGHIVILIPLPAEVRGSERGV